MRNSSQSAITVPVSKSKRCQIYLQFQTASNNLSNIWQEKYKLHKKQTHFAYENQHLYWGGLQYLLFPPYIQPVPNQWHGAVLKDQLQKYTLQIFDIHIKSSCKIIILVCVIITLFRVVYNVKHVHVKVTEAEWKICLQLIINIKDYTSFWYQFIKVWKVFLVPLTNNV